MNDSAVSVEGGRLFVYFVLLLGLLNAWVRFDLDSIRFDSGD